MDDWVLNRPPEQWQTPVLSRAFAMTDWAVVLANANREETEVYSEACLRDGIPILRRRGGGGTVLLGPGCVVVTLAFLAQDRFANDRYFRLINDLVIAGLNQQGFREIAQQGTSDLCWGDQKIAGCSLFRSRHLLLYQASLLVDFPIQRCELYLKHPSREPAYRRGRPHSDFLLSLAALFPGLSPSAVGSDLNTFLEKNAHAFLQREILRGV